MAKWASIKIAELAILLLNNHGWNYFVYAFVLYIPCLIFFHYVVVIKQATIEIYNVYNSVIWLSYWNYFVHAFVVFTACVVIASPMQQLQLQYP